MDKEINLEPSNIRLYQLTKIISAEILSHISSNLRDLGVIFDKYISSNSPNLADAESEIIVE